MFNIKHKWKNMYWLSFKAYHFCIYEN